MKDEQKFGDSTSIELKWIVHPVKKNLTLSASVIIFLVGLCVSIYFSFDSLILSIVSAIFLFGSLFRFFFPTTYILQDKQIIVKSFLSESSRNWKSFKRYYVDKKGVLLSPFTYKTRLENFRGLYIRFNDNKEQVIDFIKSKIALPQK